MNVITKFIDYRELFWLEVYERPNRVSQGYLSMQFCLLINCIN